MAFPYKLKYNIKWYYSSFQWGIWSTGQKCEYHKTETTIWCDYSQIHTQTHAACWHTNRLYMNPGNPVTCQELYFDAKGGGLWAGGLASRSGLCSGLEESFENGLGVHFRSGLRGGSLTGRAGWRRQTVFFCAIAGAWSVAEPPVENQGTKKEPFVIYYVNLMENHST